MALLENYQKKIVDDLQRLKLYQLMKKPEYESARQHFIEDVNNLIATDKDNFESALLSILNDTSEYLNLEETDIKLMCAFIYGKRHFRAMIYHLCYDFGLLRREVSELLKDELTRLYHSIDEYRRFDIWTYSDLIEYIYSNELIPEESKMSLRNAISFSDIQNCDDLRVFLTLNANNPKVSRYKNAVNALDQIAVIQNMGLMDWHIFVDLTTIRRISRLLKRYGFEDAVKIFDEYIEIIAAVKKEIRSPNDTEKEEIQRLSDDFLSCLDLDAIEIISRKIAKSIERTFLSAK